MSYKILVVDDEEAIVRLATFNLEKEGFATLKAYDGREALEIIEEKQPDAVLLDIMLPELDGYEVCKQIRQKNNSIPVLMLTAKDEEIDKVLGLELGADDYITKPFSPREMIARVRAVLRRSKTPEKQEHNDDVIKVGRLEIDSSRYKVTFDDKPIELTPKEFELLNLLVRNIERVMTREILLDHIWGYTYAGDTRIVDVHISNLREKIELNPKKPSYIKTIRGVGYQFKNQDDT